MKKKPVECHSLVLTDIEGMSVKFGYTSGLFTVLSLHTSSFFVECNLNIIKVTFN